MLTLHTHTHIYQIHMYTHRNTYTQFQHCYGVKLQAAAVFVQSGELLRHSV